MFGTWWSIVPPLVAIGLALITKEVYSSLFIGVVLGALFVADFMPWESFESLFKIMTESVNLNIIIFDILLGMIIVLMARSGGSAAYGNWASNKLKSKRSSMFATMGLGIMIFVDDYFNCLTVGSVMRPVTDKYRVSRAKLAYIIDATAAPVCIIAPISSWAAAVNSYVPEGSSLTGFQMFLNTIPYNLYAWLTLIMVALMIGFNWDFGLMKKHEKNAGAGDLFTTGGNEYKLEEDPALKGNKNGKVMDLVLPVVVLIVASIVGMIYTGYRGGATNVVDAFAGCSAEISLIFGTMVTIIFTALLYLPRKVITFKSFMDALVDGAKLMIPAILILTFAWTLKGMGDALGIAEFVQSVVGSSASASIFIPAIMFAVALFLAFTTGTSWGTFAILIPIVVTMYGVGNEQMMIISIAAVLAGAVCGDHVSPISDTTIMSSSGAQCNHINHVNTQMQYVLVVAASCVPGYIIAALTKNWIISMVASIAIMLCIIQVVRRISVARELKKADNNE